jgi:sulfite reductase (NADPH) hemoprotein beta-component
VDEATILEALEPLFASYAAARAPGEGFGDFLLRSGVLAPPPARRNIPAEVVV